MEAENDPDPEVRAVATEAREELARTDNVEAAHRKVQLARGGKGHLGAVKPGARRPSQPPTPQGRRIRPISVEPEEPETRMGRVTKLMVETGLKLDYLMAEPADRRIATAEKDRFLAEVTRVMAAVGQHKKTLLEDYERGRNAMPSAVRENLEP